MSNKHLEAAERRLHNGTNNEVARAGVEATLALAHEQRTANLIAMQQLWLAEGAGPSESVGQQIAERLGLA